MTNRHPLGSIVGLCLGSYGAPRGGGGLPASGLDMRHIRSEAEMLKSQDGCARPLKPKTTIPKTSTLDTDVSRSYPAS